MAKNINIEQISVPVADLNKVEQRSERDAEKEKELEKLESPKSLVKKKTVVINTSRQISEVIKSDPSQQKTIQAVEDILADGLDKIYLEMSPQEQSQFKKKGEDTALKISLILSKVRISADKIVRLIKNWLKLIPRANRFFLEQEAKIKTDKILKIKKQL